MDRFGVWLSLRTIMSTERSCALLCGLGSAEAIYRSHAIERISFGLTDREQSALNDKSMEDVERVLARCSQQGISMVHSWQPDYPFLLKQIVNPPFTLFYRGNLACLTDALTVAIVGTRSCTRYGVAVTERLAEELSGCGVVVVSGLADGIDASASLGALKGGGPTVAVLGTGVERAYPAHNGYLMQQILEQGGLIVSEYPPDFPTQKANFPARNRIISGLSHGIVVVEAPRRSGALITASLALEQNRDLFAVPGNVTSYASEGTNALLKDNCAKLVTDTSDILVEYLMSHARVLGKNLPKPKPTPPAVRSGMQESGRGPVPLPALRPGHAVQATGQQVEVSASAGADSSVSGVAHFPISESEQAGRRAKFELELTKEETLLLELLQAGDRTADQLIVGSQLPVGKAMAALTMLEAKGRVKSLPGGKFCRQANTIPSPVLP